jgi:hypothetical protein
MADHDGGADSRRVAGHNGVGNHHPDLCGEAGPRVMSTVVKTGSQKTQAGVGITTSLYLFHFLFLLYMYSCRFVSGPMYFSSFVKKDRQTYAYVLLHAETAVTSRCSWATYHLVIHYSLLLLVHASGPWLLSYWPKSAASKNVF